MAEPMLALDFDEPDVSHLITEDDTPVDNWFQGRQRDLLCDVLRSSWSPGFPYIAASDVAIFYAVKPGIAPDLLLSLNVEIPEDYHKKNRRSYFVWSFGKVPDLVIEIVSNKIGGEDTEKLQTYRDIRIPYYVIFDPFHFLSSRAIRIFQLNALNYVERVDRAFSDLGLGLTLWDGTFDGMEGNWLRWTDADGALLETGLERSAREALRAESEAHRAQAEAHRADEAQTRADQERARADEEQARRESLEQRLRDLGLEP